MASSQPAALPSCPAIQTDTSSSLSWTHPLAAELTASIGAVTAPLTVEATDLRFSLAVFATEDPLSSSQLPTPLAASPAACPTSEAFLFAQSQPSEKTSAGTAAGAPDTAAGAPDTAAGAAAALGVRTPLPTSATRRTPRRRISILRVLPLFITCSRPQ